MGGDDLPELEPLSPSKKPRRSSVRIATMKSVSFQRNQSTETKHEAKHETKLEGVKTIKSENKLKQEEVVVSREKGVKKEESTGKKRSRGAIKPEAKEEKHKAKVSKKAKKVVQSTDPYPNHLYPLPSHCAKAVKGLQSLHGKITRHPPRPVLDSLIGTILSQNTTDDTSARAFANLKRRFPAWEEVRSPRGGGGGADQMLRAICYPGRAHQSHPAASVQREGGQEASAKHGVCARNCVEPASER